MHADRIPFRARLYSSVFALLCCCLPPSPQAVAASPVTVRIALSEAQPPASFVENGEVTGVLKEVLKALFSFAPGYHAEFHAYPWSRAQRLVEHGQMDMFVTFPSANRKEYANFSAHPVYRLDYGNLVYDIKNSKAGQIEAARSFADLKDLKFVSQEMVAWETENVPAFIQRYSVNGPPSLMHMTFARKTGDFFIMPAEQAIYFARQLGYGSQLGMKKVGFIPNSMVTFHIGIRKNLQGNKELMAALEAALQHPEFLAKKKAIELKYRELVAAGPPHKVPSSTPI